MKLSRIGSLAIAALAALTIGSAAAQKQPEPLRVGVLLSLSGPAASFGIPERDAIEVLTKQLNESGGINGRKIELSIYDDATSPTEAARGMLQLIRQKRVVAVIGSTIGSGTLAAAPIAMQSKVPVLAPNGTDAVVSKDKNFYPWVFRTLPSDSAMAKTLLDSATARGEKKIGVFYQEDAYGQGMYEFLLNEARQRGLEIVGAASAPMNATDLGPQATRIRNRNPDVVLLQASAASVGAAFVRAAKQVGLTAPIWAQGALAQQPFIDAAGPASEGIGTVVIADWLDPTPELKEFADLLIAAGKPPQGFGEVIAANGFHALVAAAKTIDGEITGEKLRDALEKVCDLKTYSSGTACYSADNHDGWGGDFLEAAVIRDGKIVTIK